ncbi:MAG: hypothetical protein GY943_29705 [Chloroflexi bacterium]|nr:hypothetical protein [Chloroflexota bacterium]
MNITEIFGLYHLGMDTPEDYILWAEDHLLAGSDSSNMAILASMDFEKPIDTHEVLNYFRLCLDELNIEWPDDVSISKQYSKILCQKIISKKIEPFNGMNTLANFFPASGYSAGLSRIWYDLKEDFLLLENGSDPRVNLRLSFNNSDLFIIKVADQYLTLLDITLPNNFFQFAYCLDCHHIGKTIESEMDKSILPKIFSRKGPVFQMVCANCSSTNVSFMSDYEARQIYLVNTDKC